MRYVFLGFAATMLACAYAFTRIYGDEHSSALPDAPPIVARLFNVSPTELNECAVEIALKGNETVDGLLVDVPSGDLVAEAAKYDSNPMFAGMTIYHKWVAQGRDLCVAKKLRGEAIVVRKLEVSKGYHLSSMTGSRALVKDGDPEPVFGCVDGWHDNGNGCSKDDGTEVCHDWCTKTGKSNAE